MVQDSAGDTAYGDPSLTVYNPALSLSGSLASGIIGGSYNSSVSASGGTGGPYTYAWSGTTPPGLTLNTATGAITGTPTNPNTYNFTISVSDGSAYTPTFTPQPYSIIIYPAITISPSAIPAADALFNYTQAFSASGGSGSGYSYSISAIPAGMSFSGSTLSGPPSVPTTYSFTITAHDSLGFSGTSPTISLTVNPTLTLSPGTLSSGQAGTAYPSTTFSATGGSGSYTYSSSGTIPGLTFSSGRLSGTPTSSGKFPFSVTVKDGLGYSVTNSFTVSVANPPITVTPTSVPSGTAGAAYPSQVFTATGGDGGPYTFSISPTSPFGLTFTPGTPTATLSGTPTSFGTTSVTVSATDGTLTGQSTFSLTVAPAPLTLTPSLIPNGAAGTAYAQTFTAGGGRGSYTFSLAGTQPPGLNLTSSGNTATLSGTPTTGGAYSFTVQVTDGTSTTPVSLSMTVSNTAITLSGPAAFPAGIMNGAYPTQTFTASGGNGGPYTFTMSAPVPGLSFSGGVLSGTPSTASTYGFTISVSDGSAYTPAFSPKSYSITVYPVISVTPIAIPGADATFSYSQTFSASGGSGSGYTYTISSPVPGLTLGSAGILSGAPSATGSYSFTITAKDSLGFSGISPTISLTVNPALALSPATTTLTSGQVGTGYSQAFTASGGSGGYTYSFVGSVPAGLTFSSGVLSGTPTASGTFSFSISIKDGLGITLTNPYTLAIANPPIVVQPTTLSGGQVGNSYSQLFTATGGNGGPYTFSIAAPAPFGLSFSGATLTGTPASYGTASLTISATDGTLTGLRTYTLTVIPAGLTLSPTTIANGILGIKYAQTFTAGGGLGAYTFTLTPATPPPGLSFTASGATATLSGTPTVYGSFPLTVSVTDGSSTLPRSYTLAISPSSLSVTTSSLPGGTVNSSYAASLAASGGTPPYNWTVTPTNGLPYGLSLASNGSITGSPSTAGTFPFTATVTDASGVTASASLSIQIQPATLSITNTSPLPPALSGKPYSVTFNATGGVPPYAFSISSTEPQLTASGATLSGTPVNITGSPITYNVSVGVRDSVGDSAEGGFQFTVQPAIAGLILSAGSLAFTAVSGGPALQPQYFSVSSTTTTDVTFSAGADSPWLSVSPGGSSLSTPATLRVSVNQTGLKASTTPYSGNINVSGPDGQHQVSVSLTVTAAPPQLSVAPTIVQFTTDGTSQPGPGSVQISNAGDGTVNFSVSVVNGSSWVSLGSSPGSVTNASPVSIPVNAQIAGLGSGVYRDVIEVDSDSGTADVPVTLLVAGASTIRVVPAGALFTSREGQGESDGSQSFQIVTTGAGTVNWTATLNGGSGWLTLNTPSGFSGAGQPGVVSYTVDPSNLAAGNYYATIHIDAPSATNSPIDFLVVATVAPDSSPAFPRPTPAGVLFISSPGSPVPPAQTLQVNTSSTAAINFSTAANTYSGGAWLAVSPSNGSASTGSPGQVSATVNAAGLAAGVYQGGISFTLAGNPTAVRTVNVVLIVTGSAQSSSLVSSIRPELAPDATCSPSKIVALQTALVSNFSTPAGWPVPLAIQLDDDCGNAVSNGSVVASFSNGDAPLALQLSDSKHAVYSATWSPHGTSNQVTVTARATAPNLQTATAQIVGAVSPNQVPILYPHGTIHNMNPQAGAPLAPGTIVQIYGSGLAPATQQTSLPLPTNVSGTIVLIGGIAAPLYYVSDGQINAELPFELTAGKQTQILISANGALTLPDTLDIEPVTPGVAALASGQIIAQHADSSYVTASSPAQPGEIVTIYLAGMGLTDGSITTGEIGPSNPLAHPLVQPTVTINGESAQIAFAGLTPQAVGLYQINFTVPSDAAAGNAKLVVSQGTFNSNSGTLPIQ
jgi:uncharacterized protein (TIGR03437 family)